MIQKQDECYMRLAIELAEKGRGYVSPNPLVGAVIVKNGKVIGQGYHKQFGDAHAEINALKSVKGSISGATLYVTLEPCNFLEKKTPPCVPTIIKAGIKRVVIGTLDCNPKTCNKGVLDLRKAGIAVKVGVLQQQIERQNESYFKYIKTHLPFVILKLGISLDGRIALKSGESQWITSLLSRRFAQKMRQEVDAVLVGIGTIIKDNPRLTCRIDKQKVLTRVILDPTLQIPTKAKVFEEKNPIIIFTNQKATMQRRNDLKKIRNLQIIPVTSVHGLLAWDEVLKNLAQHNIASVLIEGGASVASSALQAKIVDKIYLFYAPKILGAGISFSDHLKLSNLKSAITVKSYQIKSLGNDFILQGYLQLKDS